MVCKVSLSSLFQGMSITDNLVHSILGKPVTYRGKEIGTIIGVNPETYTMSMEIDDWYADEFCKTSGLEFVGSGVSGDE